MKIAVVTCYFDPKYVRGQVIRAALRTDPEWQLVNVVNRRLGLLRYPEILFRLVKTRVRDRPDLYVLTFRGQEILPLVLGLAGRKPVVFDEFIVPIAYATGEAHRRSAAIVVKHTLARLSASMYSRWLRRCALILADTDQHAQLSSSVSGVPLAGYRSLPVGADETVFTPATRPTRTTGPFTVLYYGNMLPLHGLDVVLSAAEQLSAHRDISFVLVGGGPATVELIAQARANGAQIRGERWVEYESLPKLIASADLCLGGPFGNTPQAQNVVTGKTYQFLASGAPTLIGANAASAAFTDRGDCLIVGQGDAGALASKILWASQHREDLEQIGASGRATFEERYSTTALAHQLNGWVHEIMATR